ncbi:unnamed protein product [Owenia fusiformis]|uniref:Uncharacterized protein n=1 Tax=Owenia fusiformis TaxID=6347 RepID=A0A8S4Q602_OWEFU|nr:unnamed protein product [Owenia fusiformis]
MMQNLLSYQCCHLSNNKKANYAKSRCVCLKKLKWTVSLQCLFPWKLLECGCLVKQRQQKEKVMSPQPETLKERTTDRNAIEALTCNSPTPSSPLWTYDIVPPVIPNDDDELDSEAPIAKGENISVSTARSERIDDEDVEKSVSTAESDTRDQTLHEDASEPNVIRLNIEHEKKTDLNINLNTNIERIGDSDNDSDITTLETQGIKPRSKNLGIHVFGRPNSCMERDLDIKTLETQRNKAKMNNHLFNKMRCTENDTEFDSDETRLETQKSVLRDHHINRNIETIHHVEDSDATTLDTQLLHRAKAYDNMVLKDQGIIEDNNGIYNDSIDNNISTQNSTVSSNMKITPTSFDFKFTQDSAVLSNHGNRKGSISSTGLDFSDNDSDETRFDASQVIVQLGGNHLDAQHPGTPQTCTNMSESLISQTKMAALSIKQRFSDRPNEIERKDGQLFQTGYQPKELKDTAEQHRSKVSPMTPDVELTQSSGTTSRSRGSSDRSRPKKSQGQRSSNSKSRLEDMEKIVKERHIKSMGILNKLETRLSKLQAAFNTGTYKVEELKCQLTSIHLTIKHIGAANKKEREDIKGDTDTRPTLKRLQLKLMAERHGKLATVVKQFQKLTSQLKNKSIAKPVEKVAAIPRGIPSTKAVIHQDADVKANDNQAENFSKTKKMQSIAKVKTFIAPFKDTGKDTQNVNSSIQTPNAQSFVTTAQ